MNSRSNYRSTRTSLFDGIEEGRIRATSYSSHEIDENENDQAIDGLQDRVSILKRLSGDIHEEVETHNRMLDRMGNDMDSSRGFLSGTVDKFKMVFETKSSRRMGTLVASFVALFLLACLGELVWAVVESTPVMEQIQIEGIMWLQRKPFVLYNIKLTTASQRLVNHTDHN
uniref:t-SNARE coiled-coil homology domain-containing protein n=1 Tax=Oryza punctata TaxID=4537 RepID=A0A0E0K702_ORYPU